jgi:hypothetical protein
MWVRCESEHDLGRVDPDGNNLSYLLTSQGLNDGQSEACNSVGMCNHGIELFMLRLLSLNPSVTAETIPCPTETHNRNIRARLQVTQHMFQTH